MPRNYLLLGLFLGESVLYATAPADEGLLFSVTYNGQTEKANFARTRQYIPGPGVIGADIPAVRLELLGDLIGGKVDTRVALAGPPTADWKADFRLASEQV